jgi:hypothetical protein
MFPSPFFFFLNDSPVSVLKTKTLKKRRLKRENLKLQGSNMKKEKYKNKIICLHVYEQ